MTAYTQTAPTSSSPKTVDRSEIARLNDACRQGASRPGSARVTMTQGVAALLSAPGDTSDGLLGQIALMRAIAGYRFDDDAVSGERDFGAFRFRDANLFFKIDYYDRNLEFGSEDPSDEGVTMRVLTVMLSSEY